VNCAYPKAPGSKIQPEEFHMIRVKYLSFHRSIQSFLVGFIGLALIYSALTPQINTAGAQGRARPAKKKYQPPPHTPANQTIYAPLIDLPGQIEAEIVLNNRSPHDMEVTPTFYAPSVQSYVANSVVLKPAEIRYFTIGELLPSGLNRNRAGGISLSYLGSPMEVAAQITLVGKGQTGNTDITLLGATDYRSTTQEAVWWLPSRGTASMILGNSSNTPVSASLRFISGEAQEIKLDSYETKVITRRDPGRPIAAKGSPDSVRIEVNGPVGSLRAAGFVTNQTGRIISNIRYYDPQNIRQPHLFATRLRVKDNTVRMVLKNTSDAAISARPRFLPESGETGAALELPVLAINPHQAVEVDMKPLLTAASSRNDLNVVSVQVLNDGPNGSLIGSLCSINQAGQTVYDVPLRDSGPLRNSTGSYPWRLDGDYSTVISITNIGSQPAGFIATIKYEGGKYLPQSRILAVGETAAFDLNKIRDEQIPDKDGKLLPRTATIGQFHWSLLRGGDSVRLIGRGEMVSASRKVSSSYSCPVCCLDSFSELVATPNAPLISQGGFLAVYVDGIWIDCYSNIVGPFGYPYAVNWWCEYPSIVSFTTSGNHYNANGLAVGYSLTEASTQDVYYTDDGMDCYPVWTNYTDPGDATVYQITGMSPSVQHVSTGDQAQTHTISVSFEPSNRYAGIIFQNMFDSNVGGNAQATLTIPASNGQGSVSTTVKASPADGSGVFIVRSGFDFSSQVAPYQTSVIVPPQILIQMLVNEARGLPDNGVRDLLGVSMKNRFGDSTYFQNQNTYAAAIMAGATYDTSVTDGQQPELSAAARVFGSTFDPSSGCQGFWSPTTAQWTVVNQALLNPSTTLPSGTGIPFNYNGQPQITQIVYFPIVGDNPNIPDFQPAFLFVRKRNTNQNAVVQINLP
jgi:hypothetical protein